MNIDYSELKFIQLFLSNITSTHKPMNEGVDKMWSAIFAEKFRRELWSNSIKIKQLIFH